MKYKLDHNNQAKVEVDIEGVVFTATLNEDQLNRLFGEPDSFNDDDDLESYCDDCVTEDWSLTITKRPELVEDED